MCMQGVTHAEGRLGSTDQALLGVRLEGALPQDQVGVFRTHAPRGVAVWKRSVEEDDEEEGFIDCQQGMTERK